MAKDFAKAFYKSKEWKDCRLAFIGERMVIDGGMCERCKRRLGYIVHHKELLTPANIHDPDVTLSHDMLEYLCKACHDDEHYREMHGKDPEEERYSFDEDGDLIPR